MERVVLGKYDKSRLGGVLIRDISVYFDGKVIVNAEDGTKKTFYLDLSNTPLEWTADQIICSIQDDVDIKVSKY
jgi:hypothetical protein